MGLSFGGSFIHPFSRSTTGMGRLCFHMGFSDEGFLLRRPTSVSSLASTGFPPPSEKPAPTLNPGLLESSAPRDILAPLPELPLSGSTPAPLISGFDFEPETRVRRSIWLLREHESNRLNRSHWKSGKNLSATLVRVAYFLGYDVRAISPPSGTSGDQAFRLSLALRRPDGL